MKANQIQSNGGTEVFKLIAASNGVKKLGRKEGRTKQVGDVRLTWKATGEDTGGRGLKDAPLKGDLQDSWNHNYGRWNKKAPVSQILPFIEPTTFRS